MKDFVRWRTSSTSTEFLAVSRCWVEGEGARIAKRERDDNERTDILDERQSLESGSSWEIRLTEDRTNRPKIDRSYLKIVLLPHTRT